MWRLVARITESNKRLSNLQLLIHCWCRHVIWCLTHELLADDATCTVPKVLESANPDIWPSPTRYRSYNRWQHRLFCVFGTGSDLLEVRVVVQVSTTTGCQNCPGQANCQFWMEDLNGQYQESCSATTYAFHTSLPVYLLSVLPF